MRVALIAGEAAEASRALAIARTLRRRGHDATLLVPQTSSNPLTPAFAAAWVAEGFSWIPIGSARAWPPREHFPRDQSLAAAHALADMLRAFDAAWFFRAHWAMPLLRARRFNRTKLPIVVLEEAAGEPPIPSTLDEINCGFSTQYARQWADLKIGDDAKANDESSVPQAEALWDAQLVASSKPRPLPQTSPAVTVCIPYFETGALLVETLASLEQQTSRDFTVIVVDDGSPSAEARSVFDACAQQYASRGWRFLRQANLSGASARNHAAREAATEFLLFLDADDIAMPNMVERFLEAALISGDDCLVVPSFGFENDPHGACTLLYEPPGNSLIGSMADDMHGAGCIFIRRDAFQRIGGFTEIRGLGFEDYEFHVRCNLAGLRWDVLPEYLYRYRLPGPENVSRASMPHAKMTRVLRWYRERLSPAGLGQLPLAIASAYSRQQQAEDAVEHLEGALASRRARKNPRGRELKLLLLTCNFPFGLVSGWHVRVQQMIRHFGSRYELTLMTSMRREHMDAARREAFRHLHAARAVEGSARSAAAAGLPFRVREHYTDNFQAALRALPTDQFHAVIIDQIFMAELRRDVDTHTVLTEHNIESRLLRQAAERSWDSDLPLHFRNAAAEAELLESYERSAWADFPLRAAVSRADRDYMDQQVRSGRTVVAPNGADLSTWIARARRETATVLFPGHLAYLPNVDAVQFLLADIWPRVFKRKPHAKLIIAGRDPSAIVRDAVAQSAGVELCASPRSMDRVARRAGITVAPLRLGSGTRCKILESMAWGLPVVSTTLGAEGIEATEGEHLLLRDNAADFADAIVQLLEDEVTWHRLRAAGRQLVRERYDWSRVFEPLETALIELIS